MTGCLLGKGRWRRLSFSIERVLDQWNLMGRPAYKEEYMLMLE